MLITNLNYTPGETNQSQSRKNKNISISSNSLHDSIANDPVKTRLSESEAEVEEPANRKARSQTLSLVYSYASARDSNNGVFT